MEYAPAERFFRRLNRDYHFAPIGQDGYGVSSAPFKGVPRNAQGRFVSSVDAERLISLADERLLASKEHPGWGIGAINRVSIINCGADVVASPTENNPAHHDVLSTAKQAGKLAEATEILDWPTVPIVARGRV